MENSDIQALIAYKYRLWCLEHKSELEERGRRFSQWCKDNPDKCKEWGSKYSEWYRSNTDAVESMKRNQQASCKDRRIKSNLDELLRIIRPSYINDLISGCLKSTDIVETICPVCGNYASHRLSDVFVFSTGKLKSRLPRLCKDCFTFYSASSYEQEIAEFISAFYNGECIRNNRTILNGKELDLYYPEKKIAIEFNGDYWHSEEFKDKEYHYNKYIKCKSLGILLVSIFETEWDSRRDLIKQYISDLFSGIENPLSFSGDCMNNNYPSMQYFMNESLYLEDSYSTGCYTVYTCGYSQFIGNFDGKGIKEQ